MPSRHALDSLYQMDVRLLLSHLDSQDLLHMVQIFAFKPFNESLVEVVVLFSVTLRKVELDFVCSGLAICEVA